MTSFGDRSYPYSYSARAYVMWWCTRPTCETDLRDVVVHETDLRDVVVHKTDLDFITSWHGLQCFVGSSVCLFARTCRDTQSHVHQTMLPFGRGLQIEMRYSSRQESRFRRLSYRASAAALGSLYFVSLEWCGVSKENSQRHKAGTVCTNEAEKGITTNG